MSNSKIIIRAAERKDCAAMMELIQELAIYEQAPDEVTVSIQHFEESGFGEQPVWWAFVAEEHASRSIVAFALYYIRYSTWKGQRMYLEDILVTEAWRGQGIGTVLMDELIAEARRKRFQGISWQVLDWNEPAINFYRKYKAKFDGAWLNASIEPGFLKG